MYPGKPMANASGTNGLHGTANTYNRIQSGLLTQSLNSDQGNHMTLFEALTHTVEVCKTGTSAWTNTPFTAQTGSAPTLNNVTYHAEAGSDQICSFNLPLGGN